jgi:hypothetical protein
MGASRGPLPHGLMGFAPATANIAVSLRSTSLARLTIRPESRRPLKFAAS